MDVKTNKEYDTKKYIAGGEVKLFKKSAEHK